MSLETGSIDSVDSLSQVSGIGSQDLQEQLKKAGHFAFPDGFSAQAQMLGAQAPGAQASQSDPGSTSYKVKAGDTLSSIGAHYGVTAQKLAEANHLANANLIMPGQTLQIPGQSPSSQTPAVNGASSRVSSAASSVRAALTHLASLGNPASLGRPSPVGSPVSPGSYSATQAPASAAPAAAPQAVSPASNSGSVRLNVPWYSQFQNGHGYAAGRTQCFQAAKSMAAHSANPATVLGPNQRIQVATGKDSSGRISTTPQRATQAQSYIDRELDAGRPVVVGVSYKGAKGPNVDGITNHFVTITGRGTDSNGRTYYTFNDPGTSNKSLGSDQRLQNRFYVDPKTGVLNRPGSAYGQVTSRNYNVSMVRMNAQSQN